MTQTTPAGHVSAPSAPLFQPQHAPSLDGAFALLLDLFADRPDAWALDALSKERAPDRQDDNARADAPGQDVRNFDHDIHRTDDDAAAPNQVAAARDGESVSGNDDGLDEAETGTGLDDNSPSDPTVAATPINVAAIPPEPKSPELIGDAPSDVPGSDSVIAATSTSVVAGASTPENTAGADPAQAPSAPELQPDPAAHSATNNNAELPEQAQGKAIAAHGIPPAPPGRALGRDDPATLPPLPDQASVRAHEVRPVAHPTKAEASADGADLLAAANNLGTEPAAGEVRTKGLRVMREAAPFVSRPSTALGADALILQETTPAAPQLPARANGAPTLGAPASQTPNAAGADQAAAAAPVPAQTANNPTPAGGGVTPNANIPQAAAAVAGQKQPAAVTAAERPVVSAVAASGGANMTFATQRAEAALKPRAIAQIALSIQHAAAAGRDRLRLKLDPAELGRVEVRLEMSRDHHLKAQILVERPETLDLLQRDARQLQRALADAGIEADAQDLSFSLEDRGYDSLAQDQQPQLENRPVGTRSSTAEITSAPPSPVAHLAPGRIDLHV